MAAMRCPACAATVDDDAAICPKCDHIIDASFLDDLGGATDEDTDPGAAAPALDDDDTDPGAKAPAAAARAPQPRARPAPPRPGAGGTQVNAPAAESRHFDASSQLMDDYSQLATDVWQNFLGLSAPAKVGIGGAAVALLSTVFPFETIVTPAGITDDVAGVSGLGILSLVLAAAALGVAWYRLARQPRDARLFGLIQAAIAAGGLAWGGVCLLHAMGLHAPPINPHHYQPGPAIGIFLNLTAWTAGLIGAVVGLNDG